MHIFLSHLLLRALNVLGAVCIFVSLFLYENEEGHVQNVVEQWWVRVDDIAKASRSRVATFIQEVARITGLFLDRLFGKPVRLLRFIGISTCFSVASFFLTALIAIAFNKFHGMIPVNHLLVRSAVWCLIYFVILAFAPAVIINKWAIRIWGALVLVQLLPVFLFLLSVGTLHSPKRPVIGIGFYLGLFLTSLGCDVLYTVVARIILTRISKIDRIGHIVLLILANFLGLAIVLFLPVELGLGLMRYSSYFGASIFLSVFLNSIDILVGTAALIIASLLLLHRLLWPVVERPLYRLHRFDVMGKKGLLSLGVALLALPNKTIGGGILHLLKKAFESIFNATVGHL